MRSARRSNLLRRGLKWSMGAPGCLQPVLGDSLKGTMKEAHLLNLMRKYAHSILSYMKHNKRSPNQEISILGYIF